MSRQELKLFYPTIIQLEFVAVIIRLSGSNSCQTDLISSTFLPLPLHYYYIPTIHNGGS